MMATESKSESKSVTTIAKKMSFIRKMMNATNWHFIWGKSIKNVEKLGFQKLMTKLDY